MMQRAIGRARTTVRAAVVAASCSFAPLAVAAPCAGFTDVDTASSFCTNVAWMKNRGITLGCAVGLYCPNDAVTRLAMAAFMNRLGDAVLPPSVTWVSGTGGTFHTIQAAIDAAAATATATNPALVKIAPGLYNEQVTMKPYVDVEGAGEGVTTITSNACGPNVPPSVATVELSDHAQLRDVTVVNTGTGPSNCAALVAMNAGARPLDRVTATANSVNGSGNASFALIAAYAVAGTAVLSNLTLEAAADGSGQAYAFYGTTSLGGHVSLEDSRLTAISQGAAQQVTGAWVSGTFDIRNVVSRASGGTAQTTGFWFDSGLSDVKRSIANITSGGASAMNFGFYVPTSASSSTVRLDGVEAGVFGSGSWNVAAYNGKGLMEIADASLIALGGTTMDYAVVTAAAGTTRIAHSKIAATGVPTSTSGSITCLGTYSAVYVAATC